MSRINCNEVRGWDLRKGRGFESEEEAMQTIDFREADWGSLWMINSKVYELTGDNSNTAMFIPYEEHDA